ncbi:MAG: FIST C-terminal domain-containing protein, partial [Gammaproteobacteria bacterium]|nr:FIST C-terminal domain-containing protein [Gammaproteobacteria bacterium]
NDQPQSETDTLTLIFLGVDHAADVADITARLQSSNITFCGAVFPGLLDNGEVKTSGALVTCLRMSAAPTVISLNTDAGVDAVTLPDLGPNHQGTGLVLFDARARDAGHVLRGIFNEYANESNYVGEGASNPLALDAPCLFCNEGAFAGAAVVAFVDEPSAIGIGHGFARFRGPYIATRTEGNDIVELNWEPAGALYRELLHEVAPDANTEDALLMAAKRHPFGLTRQDNEDIVRDPIEVPSDRVRCQGHIPENSIVHIMRAVDDELVDASKNIFDGLDLTDVNGGRCVVFHCRSRLSVLADRFTEEVDAVTRKAAEVVGSHGDVLAVLVHGEVGSTGDTLPQMHNKTVAVGLLRDV